MLFFWFGKNSLFYSKKAVCKTISDFALEFRTARERAIENEKRKKKREGRKEPGKKITCNYSFEVKIPNVVTGFGTSGANIEEHIRNYFFLLFDLNKFLIYINLILTTLNYQNFSLLVKTLF